MPSSRPALSLLLIATLGCGSSVTTALDAGGDATATVDLPTAVDAPSTLDVPVTVDVPVALDVPRDVPPTMRVPMRHRATASVCSTARPASNCNVGSFPGGGCSSDGECTSGTNGRCVGNPHDGCRCNYDVCTNDADCTLGGPCECRLASRGASGANVCIPGNCRVDADCGRAGFCSPTLGDCGEYGGLAGYYCHTPQDECIDDADCLGLDAGFLGQTPYCAFSRTAGHWRCSNQACAG